MGEQRENLERVHHKIAGHVKAFCTEGRLFHVAELQEFVRAHVPEIAPDSPGRVLRALRLEGALNYEIVSRKDSYYRVTPGLYMATSSAELSTTVLGLQRENATLKRRLAELEAWVAQAVRYDMATKPLEVDCFLCEKPRLDKPDDDWLEVGTMGPQRRAHSSCFHNVMHDIREIDSGGDPLAFLAMVEDRERKRGLEPPPRDENTVRWAEQEKQRRKATA